MSTLRSFFKDTAIYGVAAVLPRVISLLLVIIHTGVFKPEQYSDNTIWYVWAAYLNVLLTLGLETSFFRFFTTEVDKAKIISTAFITLFTSACIFLLVGLIFSDELSVFFNFEDEAFIRLLILTVAADTLVVVPFAYLRVTGRPFLFTLYRILNVVFLLGANLLFLIIIPIYAKNFSVHIPVIDTIIDSEPKVIYIFIANLAASIFTLICVLPYVFKFKISFDKNTFLKFMHYGLPIMIGGLAYVTNENLDKIFIENISGKEANGIYAACYKLGVFMTLYITAFRMGAEPFFFNQAGAIDAKEKYSTIMTWFVIFGTIFMLVVVCFVDFFAGILIKDNAYFQGLSIVPIILLANLFSGIYNNLSIWYKLTDRTRMGMYISIFGALLTVIFLLILVPVFGFTGAAWTTMIAYGGMMVVSWRLGARYYPVNYNVSKIAFYIVLSTFFSGISFYLLRGNFLVSFLLVLIFLIVILKKEKIKRVTILQ